MQVAGQKSQLFAGLHGRTGKDYLFHLFIFIRKHRHGNCQISLAGARRAYAKHNSITLQGGYVLLLAQCTALYFAALICKGHHVVYQLQYEIRVALLCEVDGVPYAAPVYIFPLAEHGKQLVQHRLSQRRGFLRPRYVYAVRPRLYYGTRLFLYHLEVLIEHAEKPYDLIHTVHGYQMLLFL